MMLEFLISWMLVGHARAAEVAAQASCFAAKIQAGDMLTVTEPCASADVPLDDQSWSIDVDASNLPMHEGGAFSRFTIRRENDSYELMTAGAPSVSDLRKRKFKSVDNVESCTHRRRFTLAAAGQARAPKVNVGTDFKKFSK